MTTSLLIPYRPSTPEREALWQWTHAYWSAFLPEIEIVVHDDDGAHADLFNHGQAYNRARAQAAGDVLILGDADTVFTGKVRRLREAIARARTKGTWSTPALYHHLSPQGTKILTSGGLITEAMIDHTGQTSWSGVVIVPTEAFDKVGGADERYVGHGADDVALAMRLTTLWRPVERFEGAALHLYHERGDQERDRHRYSGENLALTERYMAAAGHEQAMQAIVDEEGR